MKTGQRVRRTLVNTRLAIALLACVAISCGGPKAGTTPTNGTQRADAATPAELTDAATDGTPLDAGPAAENAPSAAECESLVDHVIELAAKLRPPDNPSTAEDKQKTREKLLPTVGAECRKLTRATYECVMKATNVPTYAKCPAS